MSAHDAVTVIAASNLKRNILFRRTMTNRPPAPTMHVVAEIPPGLTKELSLEDTDLRARFEQISDRAKAATDELRAASDSTRDELETYAARAQDMATAAADQLKTKADADRDDASSQRQATRDSWQAHVGKARTRVKNAADKLDARQAALEAELAEDYAYDAIAFALNAIDEAESATLTAIYARANAVAQRA
jgi:hypothetical protein